jgi:hypothetical protein
LGLVDHGKYGKTIQLLVSNINLGSLAIQHGLSKTLPRSSDVSRLYIYLFILKTI